MDLAASQHASVLQESNQEHCLPDPLLSEMSVTDEKIISPAGASLRHFEVFTNQSIAEPDVPNKDTVLSTEENENKLPVTKVTTAVPAKPGVDSDNTMLKTSDASYSPKKSLDEDIRSTTIQKDTSDLLPLRKKDSNLQASEREAEDVTDGDRTQPEYITTDSTPSSVLASQNTKSQEEMTRVMLCEV